VENKKDALMNTLFGKHWHHLPNEEVLDLLDSDPQNGMTISTSSLSAAMPSLALPPPDAPFQRLHPTASWRQHDR